MFQYRLFGILAIPTTRYITMIRLTLLLHLTVLGNASDTVTIDKMLSQVWELKYSQPVKSLQKADSAISLADAILNVKRQGNTRYYKAIVFYLQNKYDSALWMIDDSFEYYNLENDNYGVASLHNLKGLIYERKGWYDKAINEYINSQKFASKTDNLISQANPLHNIGLLYADMESHDKAIDYFHQGLTVRKIIGDTTFLLQSYQSLGTAFMNLRKVDSANFYLNKALSLANLSQNDFNKIDILNSLGLLRFDEEDFGDAKKLFEQCLTLSEKIDYTEGKVRAQINLSTCLVELGKLNQSKNLAEEALRLSQENGLKKEEIEAFDALTKIYEASSDFRSAFYNLKTQLVENDSLLGSRRSQQIEELKSIYETEKKEQEISLLNQENELKEASLQKNTYLIAGLTVLLAFLLVLFYFLRYRSQQKHLAVLNEQKIRMRESQMQAVIDSQEIERKRFAQDLHDGMGQLVAALQMNIKTLQKGGQDLEKRAEVFDTSTDLLKEVHQEIRNIAFNLMPQTLIKEGLDKGLEELIQKINKTGQVTIHYSSTDVPAQIDEIIQVSLYRITQELLANILKHGDAKNIYLGLIGHDDELALSLEDDGLGYDINQFKNNEGNGWRNISTRVSLIKGEIEIASKAGKSGSSTMISVPFIKSTVEA